MQRSKGGRGWVNSEPPPPNIVMFEENRPRPSPPPPIPGKQKSPLKTPFLEMFRIRAYYYISFDFQIKLNLTLPLVEYVMITLHRQLLESYI